MAEANISVSQDQFSCSICLDLLKDPVTIPCGHSYCMNCITDCWNQEDQRRDYSCPQCRQTFTTRPALNKNVVFAEVVEKLRRTKLQTAHEDLSLAGAGDVECDVCTGRKRKAVKSCLVCVESYCQTHFERHEEFHLKKPHKVTEATGLKQRICSKHEKQLEIFCRTDQSCICYLCTMDEHRNHDTVAAVVQRSEKQISLEEMQGNFQQSIQETEKKIQELKAAVESHKISAQTAVKDSERIFTELIRSIEKRRSEVIQMIRDREKTEVSRAEGLVEKLEKEIEDLRRRNAELKQLSQTDDHIQFLQRFQSISEPPEYTDIYNISVSSVLPYEDVVKSVSQLKEKLEEFWKEEKETTSSGATKIYSIYQNEPKIREHFLQYYLRLSLDQNTAHKRLSLTDGNRAATNTDTVQPYPDHPDRFENICAVLCRESVSGRCYWEVELMGNDDIFAVGVAVSYKSINRKGDYTTSGFGYNDQSWRLYCSESRYSFHHNNKWTDLPVSPSCSRVGVYVDHRAGILSFFSVSDTMTLIHSIKTTFTQPLYPGFWIDQGSGVKLL